MIYETNDKKLIDGSAEFFEKNPALRQMFVSEDGQYFYTVSASNFHCKAKGAKLFRLTRSQAIKPKAASKPKEEKAKPAAAKSEAKSEAKSKPKDAE